MGDTTLRSPVYTAFIDYIDDNTAVVMQSELFFSKGVLRWGSVPTAYRLQFAPFKDEKWLTRGAFVGAFQGLPDMARSALLLTLTNMQPFMVDGVLDLNEVYTTEDGDKLQEAEDRFLEVISAGFGASVTNGDKRKMFVRNSAFGWLMKVSEFKADVP